MTRHLTGRHVLAIAITAFGVILAANMTMLFAATGTFPGLVVKNAYVASQGWNARTAAQADLGWRAGVVYRDGFLRITVRTADDRPVDVPGLSIIAGRPTHDGEDHVIEAVSTDAGYIAPIALAPGRWQVRLSSTVEPAFDRVAVILVPSEAL